MAARTETKRWPVSAARERFSELLEASLRDGPQIVTRRGVEAAVLVPVEEWSRPDGLEHPTLKDLLLADQPRIALAPPRRRFRRRPPAVVG